MSRALLCSALFLLGGCARSEEAHQAQTNNLALPALNSAEDEEDELTVGSWQSGLQGALQVLEFGPVGAPPRFSLSCDERHNVILQWPGAPPAGDLPRMIVTIGSETRQFPLTSVGAGTPMLQATLPGTDPYMRVLTGAESSIFVRIGDAQPLVMPPSPTIAAYARQCTSGALTAAPASGNSLEPSASVNVVGVNAATDAD